MSALQTRAHVVGQQHFYLSPLPLTGTTATQMQDWISEGISKDRAGELALVFRETERAEEVLAAGGYEFERCCALAQGDETWTERVLVVRSPAYADQQASGLEKRLANAEKKIAALTPSRGRGKRQFTEQARLLEAIDKVVKEQRVEGLLAIDFKKQIERQTHYVGRGRGSANRQRRVSKKIRYQITRIARHEDGITRVKDRFGWKAFVTNATKARLSLEAAVLCYRHEYRIERIFNRLKSRLNIAPLFVKCDDQIHGLTYLLTLGVRVLTLMEFVLRRSLKDDEAELPSLHPENRKKTTDKPTAERILKAFSGISLTIIKNAAGKEIKRWLPPLSALQQEILQRLGLDTSLYQQLEIQNIRN